MKLHSVTPLAEQLPGLELVQCLGHLGGQHSGSPETRRGREVRLWPVSLISCLSEVSQVSGVTGVI